MKDGTGKWSVRATLWQPLVHSNALRGRRQARPKQRCEQDFLDYIKIVLPENDKIWHDVAKDPGRWDAETEKFVRTVDLRWRSEMLTQLQSR